MVHIIEKMTTLMVIQSVCSLFVCSQIMEHFLLRQAKEIHNILKAFWLDLTVNIRFNANVCTCSWWKCLTVRPAGSTVFSWWVNSVLMSFYLHFRDWILANYFIPVILIKVVINKKKTSSYLLTWSTVSIWEKKQLDVIRIISLWAYRPLLTESLCCKCRDWKMWMFTRK